MKKQYKITDDDFITACKYFKKQGGIIYEDHTFGISGVEGNFTKDGDNLTINVTEKPLLASWSMIERELDKFFS